jgi:hypothetical protein
MFCKRYRNKQLLLPNTAPTDWFLRAVRAEFLNIILVQTKPSKHAVITPHPPPRRLGFDPRSVHVRSVMTKWHWGRSFSEYFSLPCPYHSNSAPNSSSRYCSYQKDKWAGIGTFHIAMPFQKSGCMHIKVISLFKSPPPFLPLSLPQLKPHVGLLRVTTQNVVAYLHSSPEVQIVALASHITSFVAHIQYFKRKSAWHYVSCLYVKKIIDTLTVSVQNV